MKFRLNDWAFDSCNDMLANYYNDKWDKEEVLYTLVSGDEKKPVLEFIQEQMQYNPIIDSIVDENGLNIGTYEDRMYKCERWVIDNIKYVSDYTAKRKNEFWRPALDTYMELSGDCEDMGILMFALARRCGIPSWRIKLCAGWVISNGKKVGHAYIIFLDNSLSWKICDACFYPYPPVYKNGEEAYWNRISHAESIKYDEIWFTVNDEFSWAQKSTVIDKKNLNK